MASVTSAGKSYEAEERFHLFAFSHLLHFDDIFGGEYPIANELIVTIFG